MNRILFKRFLIFLTVAVMTFALTACSFATTDGGKDNTSNVTDDDKDNTGDVTDDGNGDDVTPGGEGGEDVTPGGEDEDGETEPEEPETPEEPENPEEPVEPEDPEEPVEPEDPEEPVEPENPEEPVEPEDPEEPETPEEPEDPEEPDDGAPTDITEVETIDELLLFADEATQILNDSYLNDVIKKFAGKSATADNIVDGTLVWRIVVTSDNITGLEVSFKYQNNNNINFYAGSVKLQNCSVKELLTGNVESTSYSKDFSNGITTTMEQANKELGNLVINVVNGTDTTTQNEGDIWCSIGGNIPSQGKYVTQITVYQIIETGVYKYQLTIRTPDSTVTPADFIENINDNYGAEKETVFTFTGIVIE